MASEIRVDKINSLSGVGTVTLSPTGVDIAGITTVATLRATTGIVTSLTAGSLTSLGAVSGTTGTFTGDVDIADKIVHTGDTNTAIRFPAADTFTVETGGSERFRVDSTGNTLIYGAIRKDNVSSSLAISGGNAADSSANIVLNGSSGSPANVTQFRTGSTERVRILSDGDVGIGTITVQNNARLQVSTNQQVVAAFEGTGGSDPQIYLGDDMTTPTDNVLVIGYDKADNRGYLTVGGDADTVFQVKNGGDIEIGVGNLVIGTSGKGIDFSATSDASNTGASMSNELLDDYEEGTWTPDVLSSGSAVTYNASNQKGSYVKIGRMVKVTFYLSWPSIAGSPTGYFDIGGLPFDVASSPTNQAITTGSCMVDSLNIAQGSSLIPYSTSSGSKLEMYSTASGAGWNRQLIDSSYHNGGSIIGGITYLTA